MKRTSFTPIHVSILCLVLGACAMHPKKDARSAQSERESENAELAEKQADLNQEHAEERADLTHKQSNEQTDLREDRVETKARNDKEIHQAHDEMVEDRRLFTGKQEQRIQEAQAEADELRTKSNALSSAKKKRFDESWRVYQTKREQAVKQVRVDHEASNVEWSDAKPKTEKALRELEFSVGELKKSL